MGIRCPEAGLCGLSCRLCAHYHVVGESRCTGCKGESRMAAGAPKAWGGQTRAPQLSRGR